MKKCIIILSLAMSTTMLSSCDFFRQLAGRPTSADIEAKRVVIEKAEIAHQARLDSLRMVQKQVSDSLAILDSLKASHNNIISSAKMGGLSAAQLSHRFCIIVGSFADRNNARKMAERVSASGYEPQVIAYNNGFTAVGVCPSNTLREVFESLKTVRSSGFCPPDAWILVNE